MAKTKIFAGVLCLGMIPVCANSLDFNSIFSKSYAEIGYSRVFNHSKFSHLERADAVDEDSYFKRKLGDANALYVSLGVSPYKNVRVGIEYIKTGNSKFSLERPIDDDTTDRHNFKVKSDAFLVTSNFYLDRYYNFEPFVGLSLGMSRNKIGTETVNEDITNDTLVYRSSKSKTSFAYGLSIGTRYYFTENLYTSAAYRYMDFGKINGPKTQTTSSGTTEELPGPSVKGKLKSHIAMIGIGYQF